MAEMIDVGLIYRSRHARETDRGNVERLAASISENQLLNPITVRKTTRTKGTTPFDAFEIVAGHHRYAAIRQLKWLQVPCNVVEMDDLHAELGEIDENLVRAELSPAQQAAAISRRKEIYEILHPETKHGGDRVSEQVAKTATCSPDRFTADAASKTNKSERSIQVAAKRGRELKDELPLIVGTSLDKGSELDALAEMTPEERKPIIERANAGEKVSAKAVINSEPHRAKNNKPRKPAADAGFKRLMKAWESASADERRAFLAVIAPATAA
jgi:ParB family transcriptional regulator, chromosome partitioning protein